MSKEQDKIIEHILERLEKIELKISSQPDKIVGTSSSKRKTIAELTRGKKINGQGRVAFIVGYFEKILKKPSITVAEIKEGWKDGKFVGHYVPELLARAQKEGLVHDYDKNKEFTLTQSGEAFFDSIINDEN